MSAWQYTAYDSDGRQVKGVLVADGESHARGLLRESGLFPERLAPAREHERSWWPRRAGRRRLSVEELAVFTRQMAVLIGAELPVDEALEVFTRSEAGGAVRRVAAELRSRVRDGLPLSRALGAEAGTFPGYYVAAVAAGESSGELARVCETLADFIETRQAVRDRAATALVYPAFVGTVSLVVAGILLVNVAPEIVALFEQTGQPLPAITRASLGVGHFLGTYWLRLGAGLVVLAVLVRAALGLPRVRSARDRLLLRLPVIGRFARLRAASLYLRTLALVLSGRMPGNVAMSFAVEAIANSKLRNEAIRAHAEVEEGRRMVSAMKGMSALPPIALQLIESGERSGRLVEMSARAATIVENSLRERSQRLSTLLEPVMMMLVGGLVLVIVLSVLLPIFDLQTTFVR